MISPTRWIVASFCLSALVLTGCEGGASSSDSTAGTLIEPPSSDKETPGRNPPVEGPLRIAVIPKGTTHEFWKSIHGGAIKARQGMEDVEIIWKGPIKEDDRAEQINVVQNFITSGVHGIALAPLDDTALVKDVREAVKAGIPVVIMDSGLRAEPGTDYVSYVSTDNYLGGVAGAKRLAEVLGGKGKVILLRYQVGSASTMNREKGFLDEIAKHADIEVISDNQYAGATSATAYEKSENLLNQFPEVNGIFCPNETATFGMLRALQSAGVAGKIKFVGFDSAPKLVEALREGQLHGLVLQRPLYMGELAVRTIVDHLRGQAVRQRVDTGSAVATRENMDTPEIADLLAPPFEQYLQ